MQAQVYLRQSSNQNGVIDMKVFIVVNDYSDMEQHCGEYRDCFLNEVEAYQYALSLANKDKISTIRIIEKDFSTK